MVKLAALCYLLIQLVILLYAYKKYSHIKKDLFYVIGKLIFSIFPRKSYLWLIRESEMLKLKTLYPPKALEEQVVTYASSKIGLVYIILSVGALFAFGLGQNYLPAETIMTEIDRPQFGASPLTYSLGFRLDEGQVYESVPIIIQPQLPMDDEAMAILIKSYEPLLDLMLQEGDQSHRVTQDLAFKQKPFGDQIKVMYESLTPEYLTDDGQLRWNKMVINEPYDISLKTVLELGSVQLTYTYEMIAYKSPMSIEADMANVQERIKVTEDKVILPSTLEESPAQLNWFIAEQGVVWYKVMALTLLICVLLFVLKQRDLDRDLLKRKQAILYDFPDVVSKLTLLLGAGMTLNKAWNKIVIDYQDRYSVKRPLYEEMLIASSQMLNGMSEVEALEAFGKRTANREVLRMSAILVQNHRHGGNALNEALRLLGHEAWDIRTATARKLGEEASTKLLLPMGISFITVIIIVIAPTIMSMKL